MALPAAIAGVGAALSGAVGAFRQQSHSPVTTRRVDTSTAAIAQARDKKTSRAAIRNAREERAYALLTDPQVMGLLVTFGGLYAANKIPWHPDTAANSRIAGVAAASAVLMGLSRAGAGDLTTLAIAGSAGLATALPTTGALTDIASAEIPGTSLPWYSVTPPGMLYDALRKLTGGEAAYRDFRA